MIESRAESLRIEPSLLGRHVAVLAGIVGAADGDVSLHLADAVQLEIPHQFGMTLIGSDLNLAEDPRMAHLHNRSGTDGPSCADQFHSHRIRSID